MISVLNLLSCWPDILFWVLTPFLSLLFEVSSDTARFSGLLLQNRFYFTLSHRKHIPNPTSHHTFILQQDVSRKPSWPFRFKLQVQVEVGWSSLKSIRQIAHRPPSKNCTESAVYRCYAYESNLSTIEFSIKYPIFSTDFNQASESALSFYASTF